MKNILFLMLLMGVINTSFSQSKTTFGLRGGINSSKLSHAYLDNKIGAFGAVYMHKRYSKFYALQLELGYSNQGGKNRFANGNDIQIHYIAIAAINKLYIKNSGFHMLIGSGIDLDTDDTFFGLSNRNTGNDITFIDFNFIVGLGFEFKNGIGVDVRYKQGFIDVYDDTWHSFSNETYQEAYINENQLNSVFQLGVYYNFKF